MSPAIRHAALISTARGCGFATLGIVTSMIGFVTEPVVAMKIGGDAFLLAAVVLVLKAWNAPRKPFRDTEVWLLLSDVDRPMKTYAQVAISGARMEVFYRFARMAAMLAALLLAGALVIDLAGN